MSEPSSEQPRPSRTLATAESDEDEDVAANAANAANSAKTADSGAGVARMVLMSCERGARISQEASGIHYYLRRERTDPTSTVPKRPCAGRPGQGAGTAALGKSDDVAAGPAAAAPAAGAAAAADDDDVDVGDDAYAAVVVACTAAVEDAEETHADGRSAAALVAVAP